MGLVVLERGQTSADTTSAGPAAKRPQRVSAPGREGGRGTSEGRSLTVRSHTFKVRSLSLSHTGEVSLRSFRYVSRRVAFGRSELFSWNAMPRTATRQTLDKTPPCCSPLALRVKHCFRPSALPTRCFLRYFRFYGGGTRACRFLMLFSPPSVSHHFFFSFRGAQDVYFEHGSSKTRIPGKRPQALKARGKLLSNNFPNAKKKLRISTILLNSKPMLPPVEGAPSGLWSCLFLLEFNSALILPFRTVT